MKNKVHLPKFTLLSKIHRNLKKFIKGDVPIIRLSQRLTKIIQEASVTTVANRIWQLIQLWFITKEKCILQGIERDDGIIYEINKIRKEVKEHFQQIFIDQNYEKNRLMIEKIARDSPHNIPIKELITEGSLISQINKFPTDTTYGHDLIPPEYLKDKTIKNEWSSSFRIC